MTRSEPGCAATVRALVAAGIDAVAAPLLLIEPLAGATAPLPAGQAVLATSANALAGVPPAAGVPLLAVGDATAAAARRLGWPLVRSAGGDATDLLALCRATLDPAAGPLLLLAGAGENRALAAALADAGFTVRRHETYHRRSVSAFPPPAAAALGAGRLRAALFFSPSAARAWADLLPAALHPALASVEALAISAAAAAPLHLMPFRCLRIAARPNSADLLALLCVGGEKERPR